MVEERVMTPTVQSGRDIRAFLRRYWILIGLVALVFVGAVVVKLVVYPAFSWNRDEVVYLWQIRALRASQVLPTDGGAPLFFQPWLTGLRAGHFFSQYTPGWPAVLLAFDVVLGSPALALAVSAAAAVLAIYTFTRELTRDHVLALVAAGVMAASPIIAVQSGVYLGYLFTLAVGLFAGAALLHGVQCQKRWPLVVAGVLLGWLFMTRPFDAVLWGAAYAVYLLVARRGEWRRLVGAAGWLALGVVPLIVATLVYNRHVTGGFTRFPITAADPIDTFGFGKRRIGTRWPASHYDVENMFRGIGRNALFLPEFLLGSYLGAGVGAAALWFRRRDRTTIALVALGVAFPIGYAFFWGIYLSSLTANLSGPIYLIPAFAPLSVLIAYALVETWRRRRAFGLALSALLLVATIPFTVDKLRVNHTISESQQPWKHATDAIRGRALVIVEGSGPYLLHRNPYSENGPDLDNRLLYAADRGAIRTARPTSSNRTRFLTTPQSPPTSACRRSVSGRCKP